MLFPLFSQGHLGSELMLPFGVAQRVIQLKWNSILLSADSSTGDI